MSKAKSPATDIAFVSVNSFKDAAYQSAITSERGTHIARFVLNECPNFLDDVPKEIKAQLDSGFALRWQEINPAKTYSADWVPADGGGISVTLDYCLSYSQQAFGQLKNENPVQHSIIKAVRDAFNKYRSNKMADLKRAVRLLANEGKTSTRTQAKMFAEWVDAQLDSMKARCKTAAAREDATANEVQLRVAIDAFKKAYNQG
jgi:hypothetical protein